MADLEPSDYWISWWKWLVNLHLLSLAGMSLELRVVLELS